MLFRWLLRRLPRLGSMKWTRRSTWFPRTWLWVSFTFWSASGSIFVLKRPFSSLSTMRFLRRRPPWDLFTRWVISSHSPLSPNFLHQCLLVKNCLSILSWGSCIKGKVIPYYFPFYYLPPGAPRRGLFPLHCLQWWKCLRTRGVKAEEPPPTSNFNLLMPCSTSGMDRLHSSTMPNSKFLRRDYETFV